MNMKRDGRSGSSRASSSYGLDYGLKHKKGIDTKNEKNRELLNARDPYLIVNNARAITVASDNCNPYDPEPEMRENRLHWGKNENVNQAGLYNFSASDQTWEELGQYIADRDHDGDISKVQEIEKYQEWGEMALEVGEYIAGNGDKEKGKNEYQIAVQTHADEHGQHGHIQISTVNMVDGSKMNYDHDELFKIYDYADKVYKSRGLTVTQAGLEKVPVLDEEGRPVPKLDKNGKEKLDKDGNVIYQMKTQRKGGYDNLNQGQKVENMLAKGRYSYVDDLNCQFELTLADPRVKTSEDAIKRLRMRNVAVDSWNEKNNQIKAHIISMPIDIKDKKGRKVTQKKGTPSKSMVVKSFDTKTANAELAKNPKDRKLTQAMLLDRANKYHQANEMLAERNNIADKDKRQFPEKECRRAIDRFDRSKNRHHYDWRKDLDIQVYEVLLDKKADVHSREDLSKELLKRNVQIDQLDDNHKHVKAHFTSLKHDVHSHGNWRLEGEASASKRLGKSLSRPELDDYLKQSVEERSEVLQERLDQTREAMTSKENPKVETETKTETTKSSSTKVSRGSKLTTQQKAEHDKKAKSDKPKKNLTNKEIVERAKERPKRTEKQEAQANRQIMGTKNEKLRRQAWVFLHRYPNITADEAMAMAQNMKTQSEQAQQAWDMNR